MKIRKNHIVSLVVFLVVVALAVFFYLQDGKNKPYSVVYLKTGEIYIGKVSSFGDVVLKDGYIFQVTQDSADPEKKNFQIKN